MDEYTVKDYSGLDDGANTINNTVSNIKTTLNNGNSAITNILNDSTFKGPIADHCAQVWEIINAATSNNLDNFSGNASAIKTINENYKQSDDDVSTSIGGI